MPQATPKDWWYTQNLVTAATTSAATTIITNPYQNANTFISYPQQVQLSPNYPPQLAPQPPLMSLPVEGRYADYPEIAHLRRRISEVTQLCAA